MSAHEKHTARAERTARRDLTEVGRELRLARLNHDLSQRVAASAAGTSHTTWGRLERGEAGRIAVVELARILAVVGLDLNLRAFPAGSPLRDKAHVLLLETFRKQLGQYVRWSTEVAFPNPGDRRSWDGLAVLRSVRVGVEAETRARDSQELQRRINGKRKDGVVDHVVLLLADTRHNRAFLRAAGEGFHTSFPVDGQTALARLARSQDPGGGAIVLLPLARA